MADSADLKPMMQQLIDMIGLYDGKVRIEIHEGYVSKVNVSAKYRLILPSGQTSSESGIQLDGVPGFLESKIQQRIVDWIGPFGRCCVVATDGNVTRVGYSHKWKPPGKSKA